jgi:glycosyltransferase involved in cell wall biosynthesis
MPPDLRIGFVSIQDATDINAWSGIPAHVLQSLRKMDVHVEVYSPLSEKSKYLLAPVKALARIRRSGVTLDHYPLVLKSYARQIARAMRERPVDVIVATSSIPVAALDCAQPIIFWTDAVFHGMFEYYKGTFGGMPPAAIQRAKRQEEAALGKCAFAAYASEWAASSARQLADPEKIQVLPFGASFAIQHTRSDVEQWARQRRQQRPGGCELLFIGVDWQRKGGAIAVETARILNELGIPTTLTVVGCRPPAPLPDYVHVLGFISKATPEGRQQLQSLLREADFFIMPTLAEAAGIVFCEASAFGLPSLSYATGGVPDYVRTGVNGVCLPTGTPAVGFAHAIQEILVDADRYESLCLGAFHEYVSRLNWDSSMHKLVELCRRATGPVSLRLETLGKQSS